MASKIFKEMFYKIQDKDRKTSNLAEDIGFDWKFEGLLSSLRTDWSEASDFLISKAANDKMQTSKNTEPWFPEGERGASSLQIAVRYSQSTTIVTLLSHSCGQHSRILGASEKLPDTDSAGHQLYVNHLDVRGQNAIHYLMSRKISRFKREEDHHGFATAARYETTR